jgi:DNA-binding response OmpR family regulator
MKNILIKFVLCNKYEIFYRYNNDMQKIYSILIVEDDIVSSTYLRGLLEDRGYNIIGVVNNGTDAISIADTHKPDLILVDILLKDNMRGTDAAIKIHQNNPYTAIIFLTAHAKKDMIEQAKKSNACAYILKPYTDKSLLATIALSLARRDKHIGSNTITLKNNFYFNRDTHTLYKDNKQIPLTVTKLRLVELLATHVDVILSNEHICNYIWEEPREVSTLRSLVYRIKQTINEDLITNINGVGYTINSK